MTSNHDPSKITRVEVIDNEGRALVRYTESGQVSPLVQDEGRTLKIFLDHSRENSEETLSVITKSLSKDIKRLNDER